jgi:DNA processing protein
LLVPTMGGSVGERGGGGGALWWAALQQVEGFGAAKMLRLARAFGSPQGALEASAEELMGRGALSAAQAAQVRRAADSVEAVRRDVARWARAGIHLIAMEDEDYPVGLLDLRSPPPLLYARGAMLPEDADAVAVIGTREPDALGKRLARKMASAFASQGLTIVSGLARGIDTAAHRGALAADGGRTVAVVGCGLERIYPPENALLAQQVAGRGCLLSEVPPHVEVDRRLLLARDRIQAALSKAVVVVEAHAECGSLVTARHAAACGRLLLGVPWSHAAFGQGWRQLVGLGARPIDPESDLRTLGEEIASAPPPPPARGTLPLD